MRIIAIDPGYDRVGVAILERNLPDRENVIFSTCITTNKKDEFYDRLKVVQEKVADIVATYSPEILAIEELYFAKNTTTALRVAEARGIIIAEMIRNNIPIHEIHPNHVKIAITGHGGSKKTDFLWMIPKLIDYDINGKLDDEIDAVAIGITFFAHNRISVVQ